MSDHPSPNPSETSRFSQKPTSKLGVFTPIRAIRWHCMECSVGSRKEVARCHLLRCPLWPYRMGKRPNEKDLRKVAAFHAGNANQ